MIVLPKNLNRAVQTGEASIKDVADFMIDNYSVREIASAFAELMITSEGYVNQQPITLSPNDYDRVMALFRKRGTTLDGKEETRGRKRLVNDKDI